MAERVELMPASHWTCPDCGRDHFARCVAAEMSPEEMAEVRAELGVQPWYEGVLLLANPDKVRCPDCGAEFEAVDYQMGTADLDD